MKSVSCGGRFFSWGIIMNGRRFLQFFCIGLILSLGIAWAAWHSQTFLPSDTAKSTSHASPIVQTGSQRPIGDHRSPIATQTTQPESSSVSLPPQTAAIIASSNLVDPPRGDIRLVVISDLNDDYGSVDYSSEVDKGIALIPFWQPDLVICGGDMIAGQDLSLSPAQIEAMWQGFDDHVTGPIRNWGIPFGFTIGNHDGSGTTDGSGGFTFQRDRAVATAYWTDPAHDPGLEFVDRFEFPFYYSFAFQGIFFLVWDGSTDRIPPDKLAWVKSALGSDQAQQAKMRILLGHIPLYAVAVGRNSPGEVMSDADGLRELLEQYQVHTYISGHHHAYYPAHQGNLQLLHAGLLGSGARTLIGTDLPPQKTLTVVDINFDDPDLTVYTTYEIETLKPIELQELPRSITGHNGTVWRRDVPLNG
jgi:hypothetical protein